MSIRILSRKKDGPQESEGAQGPQPQGQGQGQGHGQSQGQGQGQRQVQGQGQVQGQEQGSREARGGTGAPLLARRLPTQGTPRAPGHSGDSRRHTTGPPVHGEPGPGPRSFPRPQGQTPQPAAAGGPAAAAAGRGRGAERGREGPGVLPLLHPVSASPVAIQGVPVAGRGQGQYGSGVDQGQYGGGTPVVGQGRHQGRGGAGGGGGARGTGRGVLLAAPFVGHPSLLHGNSPAPPLLSQPGRLPAGATGTPAGPGQLQLLTHVADRQHGAPSKAAGRGGSAQHRAQSHTSAQSQSQSQLQSQSQSQLQSQAAQQHQRSVLPLPKRSQDQPGSSHHVYKQQQLQQQQQQQQQQEQQQQQQQQQLLLQQQQEAKQAQQQQQQQAQQEGEDDTGYVLDGRLALPPSLRPNPMHTKMKGVLVVGVAGEDEAALNVLLDRILNCPAFCAPPPLVCRNAPGGPTQPGPGGRGGKRRGYVGLAATGTGRGRGPQETEESSREAEKGEGGAGFSEKPAGESSSLAVPDLSSQQRQSESQSQAQAQAQSESELRPQSQPQPQPEAQSQARQQPHAVPLRPEGPAQAGPAAAPAPGRSEPWVHRGRPREGGTEGPAGAPPEWHFCEGGEHFFLTVPGGGGKQRQKPGRTQAAPSVLEAHHWRLHNIVLLKLPLGRDASLAQGPGDNADGGDHGDSSMWPLLFGFLACHVVLWVQPRADVSPRLPVRLREVQAAKLAVLPQVRGAVRRYWKEAPHLAPASDRGAVPPPTTAPAAAPTPAATPAAPTAAAAAVPTAAAPQTALAAAGPTPGTDTLGTPTSQPRRRPMPLLAGTYRPLLLFVAPHQSQSPSAFRDLISSLLLPIPAEQGHLYEASPGRAAAASGDDGGGARRAREALEAQLRLLLKRCRPQAQAEDLYTSLAARARAAAYRAGQGRNGAGAGAGAAVLAGAEGPAGDPEVARELARALASSLFVLDPQQALFLVDQACLSPGGALQEIADVLVARMVQLSPFHGGPASAAPPRPPVVDFYKQEGEEDFLGGRTVGPQFSAGFAAGASGGRGEGEPEAGRGVRGPHDWWRARGGESVEALRAYLVSCRGAAWLSLPGPGEKVTQKSGVDTALQAMFVRASVDGAGLRRQGGGIGEGDASRGRVAVHQPGAGAGAGGGAGSGRGRGILTLGRSAIAALSQGAPRAPGVGVASAAGRGGAGRGVLAGGAAGGGYTAKPPRLPELEEWVSSSLEVMRVLRVAFRKSQGDKEQGAIALFSDSLMSQKTFDTTPRRGPQHRPGSFSPLTLPRALSLFSRSWLDKALRGAFEAYKAGAPKRYPPSVHRRLLIQALGQLQPLGLPSAASLRAAQDALRRRCLQYWADGRQVCPGLSLTARACRLPLAHLGHHGGRRPSAGARAPPDSGVPGASPGSSQSALAGTGAPLPLPLPLPQAHCSGAVSLMACCCGATRRVVEDPFDFESLNAALAPVLPCDAALYSLLPASRRPQGGGPGTRGRVSSVLGGGGGTGTVGEGGVGGGVGEEASVEEQVKAAQEQWDVLVLGDRSWYTPTKGMRQPGFLHGQGYLLPWTLPPASAIHPSATTPSPSPAPALSPIPGQGAPLPPVLHGSSAPAGHQGQPAGGLLHAGASDEAFPPLPSGSDLRLTGDSVKIMRRDREAGGAPGASQGRGPVLPAVLDPRQKGILASSPAAAAAVGSGQKGPAPASPLSGVMYLGLEHECPRGHRYFLNHRQIAAPGATQGAGAVSGTGAGGKGGGGHAGGAPLGHPGGGAGAGLLTAEQLCLATVPVFRRCWGCREEAKRGGFEARARGGAGGVPEGILEDDPVKGGDGEGEGEEEGGEEGEGEGVEGGEGRGGVGKGGVKRFYASRISQLRRILIVTPDERWRLATCPTVDAVVAQDPARPTHANSVVARFSLGLPILLPPSSTVSVRLPLLYSVPSAEGSRLLTVVPLQDWPDHTATLVPQSAFFVCDASTETMLHDAFASAEQGSLAA